MGLALHLWHMPRVQEDSFLPLLPPPLWPSSDAERPREEPELLAELNEGRLTTLVPSGANPEAEARAGAR